MAQRKLRTRQRTFMSTRMKIILGTAFAFMITGALTLYFNFNRIEDSKAFSSGDYRAIGSGDWSDTNVWEIFDGENWQEALKPPGDGTRSVIVTGNHKMIITDEIALNHLVIEPGAELSIESNTIKIFKHAGDGGITCNGRLNMGTSIIEGNGDFILGDSAVLMIGSDAGIDKKSTSGNLQLHGEKKLSRDATYIFNGTIKQHTGNGLPGAVANLVINNSNGVELDQNVQVSKQLLLSKGVLTTGKFDLTLGTSVTSTCSFEKESGSVLGNMKIWFGSVNAEDLIFPLSDHQSSNTIQFIIPDNKFQKGLLELKYHPGIPDDSRKSPFAARQVVVGITASGYFTAMFTHGPDEAWFQLDKIDNNASTISWRIVDKKVINPDQSARKQVASKSSFSNIVYGPPQVKEKLIVRFYSDVNTMASLLMVSVNGKVIKTEKIQVEAGYNQFNITTPETLLPGTYMIQLSNSSEIHTFNVDAVGGEG